MGRKAIDITSQRFGKLVAVQSLGYRPEWGKGSYWVCDCDCGEVCVVNISKLRGTSRPQKSCGCLRLPIDLTGQRFGKLVAMERLYHKRGYGYIWRCQCDCGNECEASIASLRRTDEPKRSCGCLNAEISRAKTHDLTGNKYGRLTVTMFAGSTGERRYWHCKCRCGNERVIRADQLADGSSQSCGCYQRELQRERFKTMNELKRNTDIEMDSDVIHIDVMDRLRNLAL